MNLIETPFLEVLDGSGGGPSAPPAGQAPASPFLSQYYDGSGPGTGADETDLTDLFENLHDEEFDAAVDRLVQQAQDRADLAAGHGELGVEHAEQTVARYLRPLADDAERLLTELADAAGSVERAGLSAPSEADLETALDRVRVPERLADPVFEDFLGSLLKKAKSIAKGAVRLGAKGLSAVANVLPAGIILRRLAALVRPMLNRVLKLALDRLPPELRQPARMLARRLLGTAAGETEAEAVETPAAAETGTIQQFLDEQAVGLMLAGTVEDQELLVAETVLGGRTTEDVSLLMLDAARDRFARGLTGLAEGEDPTPLVEQFLPAVLPVLRMGLSVIGRDRVVKFLAGHLGRMIAPMVGPRLTPALSRAIVDAGMKMMSLEAGEETPERNPAADAVVALVEDTVAGLAGLTDEDVEVTALLEAEALVAAGRAARAAFPARVLRRPGGRPGVWRTMPPRGPRRHRAFSAPIMVRISADAAQGIRTRDGRTLATVLHDRLGHDGDVEARLHLFQVLPGTTAARIARTEPAVDAGPGADPAAQLLPLTREAAAALLGDPEMGTDVADRFLEDGSALAVGQRLYALEVTGPAPASGLAARPGAAALSRVRVHENPVTATTTVTLRLSESLAQTLAAQDRARRPAAITLATLNRLYEPWLSRAAGGRHRSLSARVRHVLASQLPARRSELATAATAAEDGVTLRLRWRGGQPADIEIVAGGGRG
ncbi:hypothetical protein [Actinoplanes subglobosus]|uniref:Uncharacterized protein n=1 Tax=Actinoplanes subglobosus TaxID=1547892 RepID=A0ABV8IRR6_9ACTN